MRTKCRVLESQDANITQTFHNADSYDSHGRYWSYYHGGIDLVKYDHYLDYITAHTAGTVVGVRKDCNKFEEGGSYGNYVLIKHKNGYHTMYAHLAYGTIRVNVGEKVKRGQVIAYMDNTGTSYGSHLHFEVRNKANTRIDPEPYLNSDLPGIRKVTAKCFDLKEKKWLSEVTSGKIAIKTIGNQKHRMGAITIKCSGLKGYNVKQKGKRKFGEYIKGYGEEFGLFAGSRRRATTAIAIDCPYIAYKAKIKKTQQWLPTVYGRNYNLNDPKNGYAGNGKDAIDEVMIWVI